MDPKKNKIIYIIIIVAIVITVGVGGALMLLGNNDVGSTTGPVSGVNPDGQNLNIAVAGIEKDSILKSTDSGQSFEPYFRLNTDKDLGSADVLGITFYPEVKDKIIVSTYNDGLFLNEDKINQWKPIVFPYQKIYSFFLDKKDPDKRSFVSGVVSENGRIFRTEDGGVTWNVVYAEPGTGTYVSAITQDPKNNDLILAGTSAGTLIRSIDGGDTWKNIGQKITSKINYFDHDTNNTSLMYMLVQGGKIYHSYDAGITWLNWEEEKVKEIKSLNDQAVKLTRSGDKEGAKYMKEQMTAIQSRNKTEKTPSGIIFIVSDPATTGVLYATVAKGLYRSTDYGKYWKAVNIIESAQNFPIVSVAINPKNSNEISFVSGDSFYRSINYGSTWAVTPLDKTRKASFVAYDPFDPTIIFLGLSSRK